MTATFTASVSDEAGVLAEHRADSGGSAWRAGVDAAPLDFLRHQADADEDGDEQAEDRRRRQAEVLDDLDVLPGRELAEQVRRADQQHREQHQVVEHLVADRLAEHVDGDGRGAPSSTRSGLLVVEPASAAATSGVVTCSTKKSSSVSRIGFSETSVRAGRGRARPAAARAADRAAARACSGRRRCGTTRRTRGAERGDAARR